MKNTIIISLKMISDENFNLKSMKKILENRIAVITGGADGIGKATALRFASEGATALIWDWNEEKGTETVGQILNEGGKAAF